MLGAAHQGELFTAISLYSLLWLLLGQGLVAATVSQVAAATARGIPEKAAAWLALLAKGYLAIGCVLVPLGYVALPWLAAAIGGGREVAQWAWWLCTIAAATNTANVMITGANADRCRNAHRPAAASRRKPSGSSGPTNRIG